jgi:hypothetical protein
MKASAKVAAKPKVVAKPKVAVKKVAVKKVAVKKAKTAKTVSKKVAKVAAKPRKYNIRGGVVGSPTQETRALEEQAIRERIREQMVNNVEKFREKKRLEEAKVIAEREAEEAKVRRIAREAKEKEEVRFALEEAIRRGNERGNRGLSSFSNLPHDKKLEIFASNYKKLKAEEDRTGETLTRTRNEYSIHLQKQNDVLNGVRSSRKETSSSFGLFN